MDYLHISEQEIERQVLDFMRRLGISPASYEHLELDGHLHRYDIEGDRRGSRNGAYCIHTNGLPAGFVQSWKHDTKETWRFDDSGLSDEEKHYYNSEVYKLKMKAEQEEREKERRKKQAEAASYARLLFDSIPEAPGNHPYLQAKQIYSYGLRVNNNTLAVPLRDIKGVLGSVQWIEPDGAKKFQYGTSMDGLFWSVALDTITDRYEERIFICEGMATGAKAYELTKCPVVAAITCFNLTKISELIRQAYPRAEIIILADDDKNTELRQHFNPGLREAAKAVKSCNADMYISPPFANPDEGTDWDDYALKYGDERCAMEIERAITRAKTEKKRLEYEKEAEQLGIMSGSKFADFCKPLERESFLIEDWLPSESMTMLFAPSGSGKGFLVCDMAYAIANPAMTSWHGKRILKHGPVVYIAGEGQVGMRKRFAALVHSRGVDSACTEMAVLTEPVPIDDKNPESGIKRLIANIGRYYPEPVLVIMDTMNTMMSGDENKTVDATTFIRSNHELISEFHTTILNVHHTGQNPEMQGRARGSSVFKAAMDIELRLTKNGSILTLEMTKSKDTETQPPMVFNMESVPAPGFFKSTGEQDTTCVLELNEGVTNTLSGNTNEEKTTKAERFAKDTYSAAAHKFGVLIEDNERGREVVALELEDWRKVFYEMTSADNPNTKRQQFNRARTLMLEEKHMLFKKPIGENEYYCLEPSGDAYESTLILYIRRKNDANRCND